MIRIYGASDDLIEVEGDISEEFNYVPGQNGYIACSNGNLFAYTYDALGIWRFSHTSGPDHYCILPPIGKEYSEKLEIDDSIEWVALVHEVIVQTSFGKPRKWHCD